MEETKKFKASRYNHFVPAENGKRLAFNALSCGLAEMDDESYEVFEALADGDGDGIDREKHADLIENLQKGGFLIDPELDELAAIRAAHYRSRFGNRGFGLTLVPTLRCNFACDYCYEDSKIHATPADRGGVMSDEVCDNIVKLCEQRIEPKGSFGVTWYGGEPLLAPHIIEKLSGEFIRICDEKEADFHAGIITNGYLLDQKNLELLRRCRVSFAQVTIDGPREIHDQRRCLKGGGRTYDRILENLCQLDPDGPLRVSIRVNVDLSNSDRVDTFMHDLRQKGLSKLRNMSIDFAKTTEYKHSCPGTARRCLSVGDFAEFMGRACLAVMDGGFSATTFPRPQLASCGAVSSGSAVIEPNGAVQSCWATVGRAEHMIGRLAENGIRCNTRYTKWQGWSPFRDECNDCRVLPLCMGGCPLKDMFGKEIHGGDNESCASWRYNLSEMMKATKFARTKGVLGLASRVRVEEQGQ